MENAVDSLIIAFAVVVFVAALSLTMYMLSKTVTTTNSIVAYADKTNYMPNLVIREGADEITKSSRQVGIDTVITSLYRYYKENFMVKIYRGADVEPMQVFDTTIEGKVYKSASKTSSARTAEERALLNRYNSADEKNMFGAPWMGNTAQDAKYRIDLYVSNKAGYINNILVNYTTNGLEAAQGGSRVCTETFIEYMYSGETIETEDGLETITGNTKEKDKIVIEYRFN